MFYYFFEEYKDAIYKGTLRKLKDFNWYERLFLLVWIVFAVVNVMSFMLKWKITIQIILIVLQLIVLYFICRIIDKDIKKNIQILKQDYKEKHIQALRKQLNDYELASSDGISWLISCCKRKRMIHQDSSLLVIIKKLFVGIIYPLITLSLGLILKDSTSGDIINFIGALMILFVFGCGLILIFQPVAQYVMFPDKMIVDCLEDDLEYLKTQMVNVKRK